MPKMDRKQKSAICQKTNDTVKLLLDCVCFEAKLETYVISIAEILSVVNPFGTKGHFSFDVFCYLSISLRFI